MQSEVGGGRCLLRFVNSLHILCSSSVISEFSKKLCGIDRSLSTDMQQAMGFLCLAVCPKSCIYPRNIKQTPTLMDCYSGLCDNFVTQRIAVSLLLHFLQLVGCLQSSIDELQRVALKSQPAADEKDINQLPPDAKKKLNFHKFLLSIYRELPDDDRKVVISLTSDLVMPPRHQSYTACLIVHFIVLMEGKVITPNDLRPLQECLHVIGHLELLDKIDGYCQQAGLSLERTARPRKWYFILCSFLLCHLAHPILTSAHLQCLLFTCTLLYLDTWPLLIPSSLPQSPISSLSSSLFFLLLQPICLSH